ncbi:energy transducer TonB [Bacteroidota bacterium]
MFSQRNLPVKAEDDTSYYVAVEEMPEPIDGVSDIGAKLYYTDEALNAKIEGRIYIMAYVNEKGLVEKTRVLKGLGYGLDEVASDAVIKTKFSPGKQEGHPVKVQVAIPIIFKLD